LWNHAARAVVIVLISRDNEMIAMAVLGCATETSSETLVQPQGLEVWSK